MTATRTLLIGTAGLVAVFLLSANLMLVTGLFALAAFSVIVGGFILQPKGEVISFPLPAFHTAEAGNLKADGTAVAESFPQLLTFQLRTRNWWLLLLATLLCLVYCGWCINITRNILDDLLVIYLFLFWSPNDSALGNRMVEEAPSPAYWKCGSRDGVAKPRRRLALRVSIVQRRNSRRILRQKVLDPRLCG